MTGPSTVGPSATGPSATARHGLVSVGGEPPTGPALFARFAYPPNVLGLCGPDDHRALLEYGAAGAGDGGLVELARAFDGAWPYLELLAAANGIDDPLDPRVVEAYWVGNPLADRVPASWLARSLEDRFRPRAGRSWDRVAAGAAASLPVCHALHVFLVYPWVGLLRGPAADRAVTVLDRCRIRWGVVVDGATATGGATGASGADTVLVRSSPLVWDGRTLALGSPIVEPCRVRVDGLSFVGELRAGTPVALHWDWVCATLTTRGVARLRSDTARHLDRVARVAGDPSLGGPDLTLCPAGDPAATAPWG